MTASPETLVIAAYVFAHSLPIPRPGPEGKITDAELIALAVAQASTGESSDRKLLGMIGLPPAGLVRASAAASRNTTAACAVSRPHRDGPARRGRADRVGREIRLADGTLIGCANYPGCASRRHFAGEAGYGYCLPRAASTRGMRLLLVTDENGVPVGYDLVGTPEKAGASRSSGSPRPSPTPRSSPTRASGGPSSGATISSGSGSSLEHPKRWRALRAGLHAGLQRPRFAGGGVRCRRA